MLYTGERRITEAVKYLLIINAALFVLKVLPFTQQVIDSIGIIQPSLVLKGQVWRLATYMFLHGGPFHLLFNMFALWIFGTEIEQQWGTRRFIYFYLIAGIGSGILSLFYIFGSNPSILGASGAVYGVMTIYALIFPDRQIMLFPFPPMPARIAIAISFGLSFLVFSISVAHLTHLGGIVVAFLYLTFYNKIMGMIAHQKSLSAERKMRSNAEKVMHEKHFYEDVIDPILKKISDSGMKSLTPNERDTLERFSKNKGKKK